MTGCDTEKWKKRLKHSRTSQCSSSKSSTATALIPELHSFLKNYLLFLQEDEPSAVFDIGEVRNCLRFGLSRFTAESCDSDRIQIQNSFIKCGVYIVLIELLSHQGSDGRSRIYAARLLNNICTSNATASAAVLDRTTPSSWLCMLDQSFDEEDSIAAIVACLYNGLWALSEDEGRFAAFCVELAKHGELVSALLALISSENHAAAAEWVSLLVLLLCRHKFFAELYRVVAAPQQLALLHITLQTLDDATYPQNNHAHSLTTLLPRSTIAFIAEQSHQLASQHLFPPSDSQPHHLSAYTAMLQILASYFALSDPMLHEERRHLSSFFHHLLSAFASFLIPLTSQLHQTNDKLQISEPDQALVITFVRLIGNLSYRCPTHQDMLRQPIVPLHPPDLPTTTNTGLHLLLSSTSLGFACFGLREWSVVALRNALEDNRENQKVVHELEANKVLPRKECADLGIAFELDSNGKVQVKHADSSS